MKIAIPGELVEVFIQIMKDVSRLLSIKAKKAGLEAEILDRQTDMSDEELDRGRLLMKQEFENRERRVKVEALELEARELRAQAEKIEAQIKYRSAQIRQSNLSRTVHKPRLPANKQPQSQERRNESSEEGGSSEVKLTYKLSEKIGDNLIKS